MYVAPWEKKNWPRVHDYKNIDVKCLKKEGKGDSCIHDPNKW